MSDWGAVGDDLFNDNQGLAYKLSWRFAKVYGVDLEECRQLALIKLWHASKHFDPQNGAKFSTYACTAIARELHRYVLLCARKPDRCQASFLDDPHIDDDHRAVPDPDAGELAIRCLACLNPRERQIIRQRFFEGLTYPEIAKHHGVCHQRIAQIIKKALDKMRASARRLGVDV